MPAPARPGDRSACRVLRLGQAVRIAGNSYSVPTRSGRGLTSRRAGLWARMASSSNTGGSTASTPSHRTTCGRATARGTDVRRLPGGRHAARAHRGHCLGGYSLPRGGALPDDARGRGVRALDVGRRGARPDAEGGGEARPCHREPGLPRVGQHGRHQGHRRARTLGRRQVEDHRLPRPRHRRSRAGRDDCGHGRASTSRPCAGTRAATAWPTCSRGSGSNSTRRCTRGTRSVHPTSSPRRSAAATSCSRPSDARSSDCSRTVSSGSARAPRCHSHTEMSTW